MCFPCKGVGVFAPQRGPASCLVGSPPPVSARAPLRLYLCLVVMSSHRCQAVRGRIHNNGSKDLQTKNNSLQTFMPGPGFHKPAARYFQARSKHHTGGFHWGFQSPCGAQGSGSGDSQGFLHTAGPSRFRSGHGAVSTMPDGLLQHGSRHQKGFSPEWLLPGADWKHLSSVQPVDRSSERRAEFWGPLGILCVALAAEASTGHSLRLRALCKSNSAP